MNTSEEILCFDNGALRVKPECRLHGVLCFIYSLAFFADVSFDNLH